MNEPHPEVEMRIGYALDDLPAADRDQFEAHVRDCAACRAEVAQLQNLLAFDRHAANGSAPSRPLLAILSRQAESQRRRAPLLGSFLRPVPALVAAVVAAAIFAAGYAGGHRATATQPVPEWRRATRGRAPLPPPPAMPPQGVVAADGDLALGRWDARSWRAAVIDSATPDSL